MGFFGKKREDVIDLTDMHRRGLLPKAPPEKNNDGIVDFSNYSEKPSPASSSNDDFLGNLAGANNASSTTYGGSIVDTLREARQKNQTGNIAFNEMKIKLEDSEFKISQLNERVRQLESKLREFERN